MLDSLINGESKVNNGARTIRFGAFEADLRSGEVRKSGSRIKLQDQPFKVLQILLERPGVLVTREELQTRIWPEENFGDFDHAVNVAVGKLRTALGDSADNPSFIETVPRRGYRFVARLEGAAVETPLRPSSGNRGCPPTPQPPRPKRRRLAVAGLAHRRRWNSAWTGSLARAPHGSIAAAGLSASDRQARHGLLGQVCTRRA